MLDFYKLDDGYIFRSDLCVLQLQPEMMDFEVQISYNGDEACFQIFRDAPGVYYAELLYYTGYHKRMSVKNLTLMRGIRYWTGSSDDTLLHQSLGKAIETFLQIPTTNKKNTENKD